MDLLTNSVTKSHFQFYVSSEIIDEWIFLAKVASQPSVRKMCVLNILDSKVPGCRHTSQRSTCNVYMLPPIHGAFEGSLEKHITTC